MNVIFRLLQSWFCRHPHTFRERRPLNGVEVLHFVCDTCGRAVPAIERTAEEHRLIVEAGAVKPMRLHRATAGVVDLDARRSRRRAAS
jgi:hypothetical protein